MLKVVYKKTGDLLPYAMNSRTHSDEQVNQIAASIKEFGFTNPVLIKDDTIIAGHGRVMAAKKLEMDKVPTIALDGLTDAQVKAYVIADNKLALNAGWDYDILKVEIEQLQESGFDVELLGFSEAELSHIIDDGVDNKGEWNGMPEFNQDDQTAAYSVKVNFRTLNNLMAFAKLVGQPLTEKTRSIWYPPEEIGHAADLRYGADQDDDGYEDEPNE